MPLLDAQGAIATVACAYCGHEFRVTPAQWRASSEDTSAFISPVCPGCGVTQESFSWHDWTYLSRVADSSGRASNEPDPKHFGAQQMVLIERVARALGRRKRVIPDKDQRSYPRAPRAPEAAQVRAEVEKIRGQR